MKIMSGINFLDLVNPSPIDIVEEIVESNIAIIALLVVVIIAAVIVLIVSLSNKGKNIPNRQQNTSVMPETQDTDNVSQDKENP